MLLAEETIDGQLLQALYRLTPTPSTKDVLVALYNHDVQEAAIRVAENVRRLAMEEDDKNSLDGKALINYRRFYVGGVGIGLVLGRKSGVSYEWWTFAAVNTKADKKAEKFCAEMRIMRGAREVRCACIGGLVVVGENQPDGKSGKLRNTLDPCGECRECMRHPDNVPRLRRNTLILTAQPLSQLRYVERMDRMMATHKETWP